MATQDLINYYAGLLILQYLSKPKAYATIQALVTPTIMSQLPVAVRDAFNLLGGSPATGVQLDVLGKYVGVSRMGFGFNGPITLNDADFLLLIQMGIIKNNAGSSLAVIQAFLAQYFPGEILVFDYKNMQMSYYINSSVGSQNLAQLFVTEKLLPRPMGVQLASVVYAPVINTFFGFRTYDTNTPNNSPFNHYFPYLSGTPWLSYANGIGVS